MRKFLLMLGVLALICSPAMATKNMGGAMVVHTDDAHGWTNGLCTLFDTWYPGITCPDLGVRTDVDVNTSALIWFLAAFAEGSSPGVTVCYFGHDHSMPQYYHNRWGFCGPAGTIEVPDANWPDDPTGSGNSVAFGAPIVGDHLFPFYYFDVWGETGWHYCSAINPTGGYAGFVDDSSPPELDEIDLFGCVYYGTDDGYNHCPGPTMPGACCFDDGSCVIADDADICMGLGGWMFMGQGTVCSPNPCPQPGACCFPDGSCVFTLEDWCTGDLFIPDQTCEPDNPCPVPPQACCFPDGTCTYVPPDECGGTPWGEGTTCNPNPCPPPEGACCYYDGSCVAGYLEDDCYASGGTSWIMFDDCDPNMCPPPPPMGACCYDHELCVELTQAECDALPDDYAWYEGEVCDPNPCPPVATETTTWGTIKADYK
jgi:hypothetical protein